MKKSAIIFAIIIVNVLAVYSMAWNRHLVQNDSRLAHAPASAPAETQGETVQTTRPSDTQASPGSTYEEYMRNRPSSDAGNAEQAGAAPLLPAASPFSLQFNLDYTTQYFYRGILQEDSGLILQPAARLTINFLNHDDLKIDGLLATWNSFHSEKTFANTASDFTDYWYESDLLAGFVITSGNFSLTTTYTFLTSPSNAYQTVQELDFTLTYDDSELLKEFALHPYVLVGIETGADASDGADSDPGTYLELGIAPGFSFDLGRTPIAISFPMAIGLSLDNYYQNAAGEDDTFGFAQFGAKAAIPLPFGDRYGKWTLNAGASAMILGDHTSELNHGDNLEIIGVIGLQLNF